MYSILGLILGSILGLLLVRRIVKFLIQRKRKNNFEKLICSAYKECSNVERVSTYLLNK